MIFKSMGGCAPFYLDIDDASQFGNAITKKYYLSVELKDTAKYREIYWVNDANQTLIEDGQYTIYYKVDNGYCFDSAKYEVEVRSLDKTDILDLYGATVTDDEHAQVLWHPITVASSYEVVRYDNYGALRRFTPTSDTSLTDSSVDVHNMQYNYYVTGVDECGGKTDQSPEASTILLKGEVNLLQEATLTWNEYLEFSAGVRNYVVEPINGVSLNTNGTLYIDEEFFDESRPDTGKCYRVYAEENEGDEFVSASNVLCLEPVPQIFFPSAFIPDKDGKKRYFSMERCGYKNIRGGYIQPLGTRSIPRRG